MIRYEWKKMLLYRHGLFWILGYFLFRCVTLLCFTDSYNIQIEENRESYLYYMSFLEGSLTEEKKEYISEENIRLQMSVLALNDLRADYYEGTLSEEEFEVQAGSLQWDVSARAGFQKIFEQYIYVRENPQERYLLYTNGWNGLLAGETPDWLLLVLLVILAAPVLCEEYSCGMGELQKTERQSARYLIFCKALVAVTAAMGLGLLSGGLDLVYYGSQYGLPHGDYPLQSLESFANVSKNLSLWEAYGFLLFLRLFGYGFCAVLLLGISSWLKKYGPVLAVGTGVLILPYLAVTDWRLFARLPLPWGYLPGYVYLTASEYRTDLESGEKLVSFAEITWMETGLLLMFSLMILFGIVLLVWRQNTNWWVRGRRKSQGKRSSLAVFFLLSVVACLGGCGVEDGGQESENDSAESRILYNSECAYVAQNGQYLFYNDLCEDTLTGEIWQLDRNPFVSDSAVVYQAVYAQDNYIYFLRCLDSYEGWSAQTEFPDSLALIEMDVRDFSERIVYEESVNWKDEYFYGLRRSVDYSAEYRFDYGGRFFVDEDGVVLVYNDMVYRLHPETGYMETVLQAWTTGNVAYDGEYLYYISEEYKLAQYRMDSGESTILPGIVTSVYLLAEEGIYYLNKLDENKVYLWNGEENELAVDMSAIYLYVEKEYIYLESSGDGCTYQADKESGQVRLVCEEVGTPLIFDDCDYIYFSYSRNGENGSEKVTLRIRQDTLEILAMTVD